MEIVCPECHARDHYVLADGRRQCKACRRKFSPGKRKRKLPESVLCKVQEGFWETTPAETVARELQINRKTVQKLYGEFRCLLAESNRQHTCAVIGETLSADARHAAPSGWLKTGEFPMFYLVEKDERVVMVLPEEIASGMHALEDLKLPVVLVYRRTAGGVQLEQEHVFRRRLWESGMGDRCIDCLEFMLEMMKPYRGIPTEKALLYLEEMLFRYNCRDRVEAYQVLQAATSEDCATILN